MMQEQWYNLSTEEALQAIGARRSGLNDAEAASRLSQYGTNELKGKKKIPAAVVFFRQFLSPLIYVLLIATVISLLVAHYIDAYVIMGVLLLNATIGFIQETRAEKAMEALMQMAAPRARVRRDNTVKIIPARELVPGDIVLLESGDKVPADARLLEITNLKVNESTLTGESMPVDKHTKLLGENTPVADRKNMVFMGTIINNGKAAAVVVKTGALTEMGKIATGIQGVKAEKTPLQHSISKLSRYIIILFLSIIGVLIAVGLWREMGWLEIFFLAVAAAVSAIPEGLPAVVTVVLAVGMKAMANRNAIIRRLVAVETLGSATVICSDKTGTLTLNEMTVCRLYVDGKFIEVSGEGYEPAGEFKMDGNKINPAEKSAVDLHLRIGAVCNDALLTTEEEKRADIIGDPTEGALLVAAVKAGMNKEKLEIAFPRLDEIPFQSEKQYMATLHPYDGKRVAYVKGSVEKLLAMSNRLLSGDKAIPLTESAKKTIVEANTAMAQEAMRVMATAYAELPGDLEELTDENIKGNLIFVGLSGMADPPREEAKLAIKHCHEAGIRVMMITGDNKVTAESIARQLGLPEGRAITGAELQQMSDEELSQHVEEISVFARIEPLHKLRIVNALKSRGHTVAMTGDGVNDAPALKSANIGIAMGITGTDVAKESSDMVLADDNFASVVAAVEEGRSVFIRLRNVVYMLVSTNLGQLSALILSVLFIGVAPLLPVQILWINLVSDTSTAIPLGLEPKTGDELKQPPRHPRVGLIFPGLIIRLLVTGGLTSLALFLIFLWAYSRVSLPEARTIVFCAMAMAAWFKAFVARSDEHTAFKLGFFRNRLLVVAILGVFLLQIAAVYVPFMQIAFGTVAIGIDKWGIAALAGIFVFAVEETRKTLFPKLYSLGKWQPALRKRA